MIGVGMTLPRGIVKSLSYEINTLAAVIIRLAMKQHENRNFDMKVMPDSGDVLA